MNNSRLPYHDNLNIGLLSKVFERKRISNCYKYFWFQALLGKISENKVRFSYDELLNQMIEDAWYMVTEYNLRLGPCNTTDNLEDVVKYIFATTNISSTAKQGTIIKYLEESKDLRIQKYKWDLVVNVPYCLQSPFYASIKNPGRSKVDEINMQKHLLYYFVILQGVNSQIEINEEWVKYWFAMGYITRLDKISSLGYLQDRNPSVPGIMDKISKPEKRDLKRVSDYWKTIIEIGPSITEIYGKHLMKDEKMSIDHFVPWQYVSHDELWNLHPTTRSINSSKGNQLPDLEQYYKELSTLEYRAYEICSKPGIAREKYLICLDYHVNSSEVRNSLYESNLDFARFDERLLNIIKPVYNSAKMCGFTEWVN